MLWPVLDKSDFLGATYKSRGYKQRKKPFNHLKRVLDTVLKDLRDELLFCSLHVFTDVALGQTNYMYLRY